LSKSKFFFNFYRRYNMNTRIYHLLLAAATAALVTACDNTNTTEDTTGTGSAGGVGTQMDAPMGAETAPADPAGEIPSNVDEPSPGSDMSNTDPETTNTNP
jgi:hypothetical protein